MPVRQKSGFFAAAAKEKWIAAFQPRDAFALRRLARDEVVDLGLFFAVQPAAFTGENFNGSGPRPFQQLRVDQGVIDHDIGARERVAGLERQKARISGPRADQIDFSLHGRIEFIK